MTNPASDHDGNGRRLGTQVFALGLAVIFAAFYSQYFFRDLGPWWGAIVVYGIPFVTASLIRGRKIVGIAFRHTMTAFKFGVSSFGMFELLGGFAGVVLFHLLTYLYPDAEQAVSRHNPALNVSHGFAWVMIVMSIAVVGPVEEYVFRGFIYGGMLELSRQHHWLSLALLSSVFFAVAHLYYAMAYGVASLLAFVDLMAFSMAMSFTYYFSGGNLIVPALIHGIYDAAGFLNVAVSPAAGSICRGTMVIAGIVVAVVLAVRSLRQTIAT
jgi:membrane protease YdiL (CAAX protease family)